MHSYLSIATVCNIGKYTLPVLCAKWTSNKSTTPEGSNEVLCETKMKLIEMHCLECCVTVPEANLCVQCCEAATGLPTLSWLATQSDSHEHDIDGITFDQNGTASQKCSVRQ